MVRVCGKYYPGASFGVSGRGGEGCRNEEENVYEAMIGIRRRLVYPFGVAEGAGEEHEGVDRACESKYLSVESADEQIVMMK